MQRLPLLSLLVVCSCAVSLRAAAAAPERPPPRVFCVSREGLASAQSRLARHDPDLQPALEALLAEANRAMDVGPFSVVLKGHVPPSGNKHDYMSIAPYEWPDPTKPNGLPYKGRDGLTNPEWWEDYDRVPLERMTQATETLALAYAFTGQAAYARRAAHLLRIWFLDPATAMTPDLEFSQGVPGRHFGRTLVIDTRFFPRVIDAVGLLAASPEWTAQDQAGMVAWFRQFLGKIRRRTDESYRTAAHNIASFYHVQVAAMALFVGDEALAREIVERTKARLALAVGEDGFFTVERNRTRSFSYSCFHLYALFNLATMGRLVGIDLWNFSTDDHRDFRRALDTVASHAGAYPPKDWPFKETDHTPGDWWDPFHDELPVVLHHAAHSYQETSYERQAAAILTTRNDHKTNRLHLLCGLPLPGQQSLQGWLFHPGGEH